MEMEYNMLDQPSRQRDETTMTTLVVQNAGNGEQENSRLIRVLLADDHALVREGTRRLLEAEDDVEVVAEAASGEEAIAAAQKLHPDIAIMISLCLV